MPSGEGGGGGGKKKKLIHLIRKKMAAEHFTTIPCELNTANRRIESLSFVANFVPALKTLCMLGLKFF